MSLVTDSEVATAALAVGGSVGHVIGRWRRRQQDTRSVLQGLVWAVGGKPADELGPRVPGLVDQVRELAAETGAVRERMGRHEAAHDRREHPVPTPARVPEGYFPSGGVRNGP